MRLLLDGDMKSRYEKTEKDGDVITDGEISLWVLMEQKEKLMQEKVGEIKNSRSQF